LGLLLLGQNTGWAIFSLSLFGFFHAPLTIWAQTLRMQIIPEALRGRTFALLRTLMQGTNPVGGVLAGFLLPILGIPAMIGLSAMLIGVPGLFGYRVKDLRRGTGVRQESDGFSRSLTDNQKSSSYASPKAKVRNSE
jgi:hypothetical protein